MKTLSFEKSGATVMYDQITERLYVQIIDEYAFQRELTIRRDDTGAWEIHAYTHPGRRKIYNLTNTKLVRKFIQKFLDTAEKYPDLYFNPDTPRCRNFVYLHERLLWGEELSLKML